MILLNPEPVLFPVDVESDVPLLADFLDVLLQFKDCFKMLICNNFMNKVSGEHRRDIQCCGLSHMLISGLKLALSRS